MAPYRESETRAKPFGFISVCQCTALLGDLVVPGGRGISTAVFYCRRGGHLFKEEDPEAPEADGPRGGTEA